VEKFLAAIDEHKPQIVGLSGSSDDNHAGDAESHSKL